MITITKRITVFFIGTISSIMLLFMLYAGFANFFTETIQLVVDASDYSLGALIIFVLIFITFLSSFIISIFVVSGVDRTRVYTSSVFTLIFTILFVFGISFLFIYLYYPQAISDLNLSGLEYIYILLPLCVFYFSVYILSEFIYLVFIIVFVYFLILVIILGYLSSNVDYKRLKKEFSKY